MADMPTLVADDTAPFVDITFATDITGAAVAVRYRIDAAATVEVPGAQVTVIDTGGAGDGDGTAKVRVTWAANDLTPGIMLIEATVTFAGGEIQTLEEPLVVGVRNRI